LAGTTSQYTQSYSDWLSPSSNANEAKAVAMSYRDTSGGTEDNRQFNLYAYTLNLNPTKAVRSLILPANCDVVSLAITLTKASLF